MGVCHVAEMMHPPILAFFHEQIASTSGGRVISTAIDVRYIAEVMYPPTRPSLMSIFDFPRFLPYTRCWQATLLEEYGTAWFLPLGGDAYFEDSAVSVYRYAPTC